MRGHLGFKCRSCIRASAPVATAGQVYNIFGDVYQQYFTWSRPSSGSRPILRYVVSVYDYYLNQWVVVANNIPSDQLWFSLGWCRQEYTFRVAAETACGLGDWSNSVTPYSLVSSTPQASIFTASGTTALSCEFWNLTAFAIGRGGQFSTGGGGGGLSWKTWTYQTRNPMQDFSTIGYSITSSQTTVTFNGQTITAYAGSNTEAGGFSGGDGGASGNPPGQGSASFADAGISYSGNYHWGGSIGGNDPGGPGGTQIYPSPVSPCRRQPARDRNSLLSRVALAGGKATEDCGVQAAFGSGGVKIPVQSYGSSSAYFAPGYGGGGFDSECPAGPGAVVLYFH